MLPDVPVTVWEQIPVIIIFAFLLAGGAWLMVKAFKEAVADINRHYSSIIEQNNKQWQAYFDARSDANKMVDEQIISQLSGLTQAIEVLSRKFQEHDLMERQALDAMNGKRKSLLRQK